MAGSRRRRHLHYGGDWLDVREWLTWAIRGLLAAAALGAWQAYGDLKQLGASIQVIDAKLDSHADQLKAIWQKLGDGNEHSH